MLFAMSVKVDTSEDPIEMKCAFVSVCEEIVLDDSDKSQKYANIKQYLCIFGSIEKHVTILFHIV